MNQGLPTDFVTSLSHFLTLQRSDFFVSSNSLLDVESADKKNCIFSFFIFSKAAERVHDTSNCHLWPDQFVQTRRIHFFKSTVSLVFNLPNHKLSFVCTPTNLLFDL